MNNVTKLLTSIVICELTGLLSTPFTIASIPSWYATLHKPFFQPPNWIFGPVWTILYFMMGISLYLIWIDKIKIQQKSQALTNFGIQLFLNFIWSILFFGLHKPILGFVDIFALWIMIVLTIRTFAPISKNAAYLLIPYLLWVSFASILNLYIVILNP